MALAAWARDRFKREIGAGNFHPGTSPVRSRLSANLRSSRATALGPYSETASFTVTATPSSESLALSCRSNQCLIDNATCATSCVNDLYICGRLLLRKTDKVNAPMGPDATKKASSWWKLWPRFLPRQENKKQPSYCKNLRTYNEYVARVAAAEVEFASRSLHADETAVLARFVHCCLGSG